MTKIEWTERTWNPIVGCSVVSPGCTNCYAMKMAARLEAMAEAGRYDCNGYVVRGGHPLDHYLHTTKRVNGNAVWTGKVAMAPERILLEPLRRKKPTMWFVNSMSDLFHESVPDAWIDRAFAVMALCPQHTFQVLTKRSARMRDYFDSVMVSHPFVGRPVYPPDKLVTERVQAVTRQKDWCGSGPLTLKAWPLPNVWLGVSAERQEEADERIPDLLTTPAAVRFVSAEPLLGPIDFDAVKYTATPGFFGSALRWHHRGHCHVQDGIAYPTLDWIIVGGESGPAARPMHPDWVRSIRDQCQAAGVPFFFKQWGEFAPIAHVGSGGAPIAAAIPDHHVWADNKVARRVGKKRAGRLLDGRAWDEMPFAASKEVAAA